MFNAGKNILRASKTGTSQLGIPLLFVIPAALCNPILSHFLVCKHVTLCNPFFGFFKVPCEKNILSSKNILAKIIFSFSGKCLTLQIINVDMKIAPAKLSSIEKSSICALT